MITTDPKELGKQIASLRKAHGLSQARLAEVSGLPITAIRRCEQNGKIPLDRYLILASCLKASLQIILENIPGRQPYDTMEDVIRSSQSRPKQTRQSQKPKLGGMFDKMNQLQA